MESQEIQNEEENTNKESYETLFKLEQRLHSIKDQLQDFSRRRRNEAIIVTFGIVSLVTAILTVVGSDAIKNNIDNVIGKSAKAEVETSITSLENAKQEFQNSLRELDDYRKQLFNNSLWNRIKLDLEDKYFEEYTNELYFTKSPIKRIHFEGYISLKVNNDYRRKVRSIYNGGYHDFKLFNLSFQTDPNTKSLEKIITTDKRFEYTDGGSSVTSTDNYIAVVLKRVSKAHKWVAYLRVRYYNDTFYKPDKIKNISISFDNKSSYQSVIN